MKPKTMKLLTFLLFIAILLLGCVLEDKIVKTEVENKTIDEAEILKIGGLENGSITKLTPQNLIKLAEKYPVIYGNLPNKTLYQIKTEKQLIIVDADEKEVLRKFKLVGVSLNRR